MKLKITWSNGYWKLFDPQGFREVAKFDSLKEAQAAQSRKPRK